MFVRVSEIWTLSVLPAFKKKPEQVWSVNLQQHCMSSGICRLLKVTLKQCNTSVRSNCKHSKEPWKHLKCNYSWSIADLDLSTVAEQFGSTHHDLKVVDQGLSCDFEVTHHFWTSACPKWSKMVKNGLKLYKMVQNCHFLLVKNRSSPSKWWVWQVLAKALFWTRTLVVPGTWGHSSLQYVHMCDERFPKCTLIWICCFEGKKTVLNRNLMRFCDQIFPPNRIK